jgi:putative NIF3 family GTP cyclohydrolase 1 type 2
VDAGRPVRRVAVGGGACGSELPDVYDARCDTFVTADVRYNQFWDAHDLGINLIEPDILRRRTRSAKR